MSAYNTPNGVVISNVLKDGPADKSGLMPNDIITSINGIKINNIKQVVKIVASLEVNQTVILIYKRDKELVESSIKITAMPRTHKTINR
jgi:S1-C subfamily serine protease